MNVFMHGKVEAGFEALKAKMAADMAGPAGEFCTEYRLADLGDCVRNNSTANWRCSSL